MHLSQWPRLPPPLRLSAGGEGAIPIETIATTETATPAEATSKAQTATTVLLLVGWVPVPTRELSALPHPFPARTLWLRGNPREHRSSAAAPTLPNRSPLPLVGWAPVPTRKLQSSAVMYVDGQVIQIGGLGIWGEGIATDINNAGKVVGASFEFGGERNAFLYSGGVMQNLNTLVEPGWRLTEAMAINDQDQILALHYGPAGNLQYVLLTPFDAAVSPVPELRQYLVLLLGLALFGNFINRQGLARASIKP
jgi:probable HAF family extracellular repeat protein